MRPETFMLIPGRPTEQRTSTAPEGLAPPERVALATAAG